MMISHNPRVKGTIEHYIHWCFLGKFQTLCFPSPLQVSHPTYFTLQAGRGMVVGHVLMVHMCSFLCTFYIGMTVHSQPL